MIKSLISAALASALLISMPAIAAKPEKIIYINRASTACAYGPLARIRQAQAERTTAKLKKDFESQGFKVKVRTLEPGINQAYPWEQGVVASHFC